MKPFLLVVLLMGIMAVPAAAQNCGSGLPCGPLPWALPNLPSLESPTPPATVFITSAPTESPTMTPTPCPTAPCATATPTPTQTSQFDVGPINDQISTLGAVVNGTPIATIDAARFGDQDLGTNAGAFFGYALGLSDIHFGILTSLFTFLLFAIMYMIGIRFVLIMLPLLASILGFIRKLFSLILDFLPL